MAGTTPLHEWLSTGSIYVNDNMDFEELLGKVISKVTRRNEEIIFVMRDGSSYKMHHSQDCCESVHIEDINGDLQELVGSPILEFKEYTNSKEENWKGPFARGGTNEINGIEVGVIDDASDNCYYGESFTWTFYHISTIKATVTIRWFGASNGYYSETADLVRLSGPIEEAEIVPPQQLTQGENLMTKYSLENRPQNRLNPARKKALIYAVLMTEPFLVETQEGVLEYSPVTCDDWGEGYILAYPEDGSKPYAMSKTFFDSNYGYVMPEVA